MKIKIASDLANFRRRIVMLSDVICSNSSAHKRTALPNISSVQIFAQTVGRGHGELLLRFNCHRHSIAGVSGFKDARC